MIVPESITSEDTYKNLHSFDNFQDVTNSANFVRLPPDWCVVVSDVVGTFKAIKAGCYRDVNTIGAACITAVKNAIGIKINDFPYVFSGDGAKMAVPPRFRNVAVSAMLSLKDLVKKNFGMELRVGSVLIENLEEFGARVEVARYEIAPGMCVAIFRGGGMAVAEARLKGNDHVLQEKRAASASSVSLESLMCRWNAIPSHQGCVMTILVYDNPDVAGSVYDDVLAEIDTILNPHNSGSFRNAGNPVNIESLKFKTFREILRDERRFHASLWSFAFIHRAAQILLCVIIFRLGCFKRLIVDGPHYKVAQRTYADFRKFDDMLRMVIDCTKDQANAIEFMLHDKHDHGLRLFYGVFYSTRTVMTCLVEDVADGHHIHYMDGEGGGFAMAGKMLREQLTEAKTRNLNSSSGFHQPLLNNVITDDGFDDLDVSSPNDDVEMGFGGVFDRIVPAKTAIKRPEENHRSMHLIEKMPQQTITWGNDGRLDEDHMPISADQPKSRKENSQSENGHSTNERSKKDKSKKDKSKKDKSKSKKKSSRMESKGPRDVSAKDDSAFFTESSAWNGRDSSADPIHNNSSARTSSLGAESWQSIGLDPISVNMTKAPSDLVDVDRKTKSKKDKTKSKKKAKQ